MSATGRSLPFADGAFDVAHASLVVHHLDPDAVDRLLREMARVARSVSSSTTSFAAGWPWRGPGP